MCNYGEGTYYNSPVVVKFYMHTKVLCAGEGDGAREHGGAQ